VKAVRCQASAVQLIVWLRHGVIVRRRTVTGKIAPLIAKGHGFNQTPRSLLTPRAVLASSSISLPPAAQIRPALRLRETEKTAETFNLVYCLKSIHKSGAFEATLLSRGRLREAEGVLPELLLVSLGGASLQYLSVALRSPWTFLPQSTVTISDGTTATVQSSTIPMDIQDPDERTRRTTVCKLGPLLAPVLFKYNSEGESTRLE
jgi:hypothetical protein